MPTKPPADDPPVSSPTKPNLDACRRCELWEKATQSVPGRGGRKARVMLVGEQPGDEEDKQGEPFVGPAGGLLRRAITDAGLTLDDIYLTNAVKHFYWEPRGPRRIHKTPAQRHIDACRAWLEKEIAKAKPVVIVALGSTALNGVMGGKMKVGDARQERLEHVSGTRVVATYHPSAALRVPDKEARAQMYETIVADLRKAARVADDPEA
jgi:DNA polymerase